MALPVLPLKEMLLCLLRNEHLQELMHGRIIIYPIKKKTPNNISQDKIIDEVPLNKATDQLLTPDKFNHALMGLLKKHVFIEHLNMSSLSYQHYELCNLLFKLKLKPKIIEISESRLQKSSKQ